MTKYSVRKLFSNKTRRFFKKKRGFTRKAIRGFTNLAKLKCINAVVITRAARPGNLGDPPLIACYVTQLSLHEC
jgi:hypothetical protein